MKSNILLKYVKLYLLIVNKNTDYINARISLYISVIQLLTTQLTKFYFQFGNNKLWFIFKVLKNIHLVEFYCDKLEYFYYSIHNFYKIGIYPILPNLYFCKFHAFSEPHP